MYRALYRKWRPATFSDVIGQENIVTALQSQIAAGKVGHAYIFTGTRGTGKTTCAKIFAKAVNCENQNDANPCGKCTVCKGIDSGAVLDVTEIDAASNNGVDNIRDLREETIYTPGMCAYKVYIIDEVHMLSGAAFNALLKIMEEPPSHVIFILATTEIHKVPATILSRCQRYDFSRISAKNITDRLLYVAGQESIDLNVDAADLIARLADGAMRDALSILDTCISANEVVDIDTVRRMAGVTDRAYLFELSDDINNGDTLKALTLIASLREKSIDIKRLCDELIMHYRNFLLIIASTSEEILTGVTSEDFDNYKKRKGEISTSKAIFCIKTLCAALEKMSRSSDVRIELEVAIFEMCTTSAPVEAPFPTLNNATNIKPNAIQSQNTNVLKGKKQIESVDSSSKNTEQFVQNYDTSINAGEKSTKSSSLSNNNTDLTSKVSNTNVVNLAQDANDNLTTDIAVSIEAFKYWDSVINAMESIDKLLFVNMRDSKAYFDGKRVLIDGGDLFLEYMRQNKNSNTLIRQVIKDVTGHSYAIGPYKDVGAEKENMHTAMNAAKNVEDKGVAVIYDDN